MLALWKYYEKLGMRGLWDAMPRPTLDAWTHIAVFGVLEAALQMLLPGKEHKGPVTPNGNVPVYKVHTSVDTLPGTAPKMRVDATSDTRVYMQLRHRVPWKELQPAGCPSTCSWF